MITSLAQLRISTVILETKMIGRYRKFLGKFAEWYVARYLEHRGHIVWHQNWKSKRGEIDLITVSEQCVHVIEVKFRSRISDPSLASTAISESQFKRIVRSAEAFAQTYRSDFRRRGIKSWQLDLVLVTPGRTLFFLPDVTWVKRFAIGSRQ